MSQTGKSLVVGGTTEAGEAEEYYHRESASQKSIFQSRWENIPTRRKKGCFSPVIPPVSPMPSRSAGTTYVEQFVVTASMAIVVISTINTLQMQKGLLNSF